MNIQENDFIIIRENLYDYLHVPNRELYYLMQVTDINKSGFVAKIVYPKIPEIYDRPFLPVDYIETPSEKIIHFSNDDTNKILFKEYRMSPKKFEREYPEWTLKLRNQL